VGDPAPAIYARLFAEQPETEALFVRDASGAVRGEMLAVAFQCLLDLDGAYGANFIAAERVNHDAFGVSAEAFARFFPIVRDVCRELLGDDWTPAFDGAWAERLARVGLLTRAEA
jgi:hemoglobin-like flavoprotein